MHEAIKTARVLRKNGMKVRSPWRQKNYRLLSFTQGYGWKISQTALPEESCKNRLRLSLGRGRPQISLPVPEVVDSETGQAVPARAVRRDPAQLGQGRERLVPARPYYTQRSVSEGTNITAVDEGIINPLTLATWIDETTIDVTIINGRAGHAMKRLRNKSVGSLHNKISKCKPGSKSHRRLVSAKKKIKSRARRQLRDFGQQMARKSADHVIAHDTARLVVGDVHKIAHKTKVHHRANRHMRQQLSQWSRGTQEQYLEEKTGLEIEYLNELGSTRTCPKCLIRNRPSGRDYRCMACSFACHRDAVGTINFLQRAIYGEYTPIGADTHIRVTYLRAVQRWSQDQRQAHSKAQSRKARALSSAQNRASLEVPTSKSTEANSSTSSPEPDPMVVVA